MRRYRNDIQTFEITTEQSLSNINSMDAYSYLSSDEHEDEEEEEIPVWRLDPEVSFSDWTIRVVPTSDEEEEQELKKNRLKDDEMDDRILDEFYNTETKPMEQQPRDESGKTATSLQTSVYHVHRVHLASGYRKSEYFQTLFSLRSETEDSLAKTTELSLPESARSVFPRFLDYVYDSFPHGLYMDDLAESAADCSENACRKLVALWFLGDYLRVSKLLPLMKHRIEHALVSWNVHIFCREAMLYGIDWIVELSMTVAANFPRELVALPKESSNPALDQLTSPFDVSLPSGRRFPRHNQTNNKPHPSLQTMNLLPEKQQLALLQKALANAVHELRRFKRVPSSWKNAIEDNLEATHMPSLSCWKEGDPKIPVHQLNDEGCALPFSQDRVCPIFYYDNEAPAWSNASNTSNHAIPPLPQELAREERRALVQLREMIRSSSRQNSGIDADAMTLQEEPILPETVVEEQPSIPNNNQGGIDADPM